MPPAIPILGAAAVGALAGVTVTAAGVIAFSITAAAIGALVSAALAGVSMLLSPKPKKTAQIQGLVETSRNPTAYRRQIYGKRRVGGTVVFIETRGATNAWVDIVIAIAGHEIEAFDEMYFGDEQVWTSGGGIISRLTNNLNIEVHTGVADDPASPYLIANNASWTANHKLGNIAYAVVSLKHSSSVYPAGIPNISFIVRGKKVYDPRDLSTAYSNNAALCIRDFLTDDYLGFGASASEIDDASFITGANLSDELVNLDAGGTEKRYVLDGVIDANTQFGSAIEGMLSSMGAKITYTAGKFRLVNPEYNAPTLTLDESHARGPIQVQTRRSRRDTFNGVRGVFPSSVDNFTEQDYPPVISSTFAAEDGEPIYQDLPLPFTTSASMAQRLAKIELLKSRSQITVVIPVNLAAMELVPGDTVAVTNTRFGWSAKTFEVDSWAFTTEASGALGIDLVLVETSSALFDWTTSEEAAHVAGIPTTLPDGFTVLAPGIITTEEERTFNQDIVTVLIVDVSSSDGFFDSFEVDYKLNSESTWRSAGRTASTRFEVTKVGDGLTYDIRARVKSVTGAFSAYTQIAYIVSGASLVPDDVTGLVAHPAGPHTILEWTPLTDTRLSHYVVRHTPKTSGFGWESATTIVPKVARPASSISIASRPGTYFVKASDKLGRLSTNAASILSPLNATDGLNVVVTVTEDPAFSGTHTSTKVITSSLSLIGPPYGASGTYEFNAVTDLGAIFTSRVFANLIFDVTGGASSWDNLIGTWDNLVGTWDSLGAGEAPGTAAWIEMATTRDDTTGSPVWTAWAQLGVHEVEARGFKFRAQLTSDDTTASPLVTALGVTIDMPDRVAAGVDTQSGTAAGGLVVTYAGGAFHAVPALGIVPQDMVTGDYYEIVAKSVSSFTIRFKNSAGTVIDRKFDHTARGYGSVI